MGEAAAAPDQASGPVSGPVTVVFVNYYGEDLIAPRVAALEESGFGAVVVDNSGTYAGGGTIVATGVNLGFGAGCNRAVTMLDPAATVVLHNPDVDVPPDALRRLVAALDAQSRPGLAAPAIDDGRRLRLDGYRYPSAAREALLGLGRALVSPSPHREPQPSRSASGPDARARRGHGRRFGTAALLAARVGALQAVGGFDERYFLYAEDLDLWHRVGRASFTTAFVPDVVARHQRAAGSEATPPTREILRWLGVELFAEANRWSSWRRMRAVHRRLLGRLAAGAPELAAVVAASWRDDRPPSAVYEDVRTGLLGGALLR
jgi:N-acetylglucosaminyl-diphospho-decaprenol L-rhamnosyltransferase